MTSTEDSESTSLDLAVVVMGDAVRPGNYTAQLNMADHYASTAQLTVCSLRAVILQEGLRQAEDADGN